MYEIEVFTKRRRMQAWEMFVTSNDVIKCTLLTLVRAVHLYVCAKSIVFTGLPA